MKRTVTAVTILVISVCVGTFSYFFVKNTCRETFEDVQQILQNAVTEKSDKVNLLCVQANQKWEKKNFWLNILIGREYTGEVSKLFYKMINFAQKSDYDSVISTGEDCKAELVNIIESNEPKLSTIF